jgi:hypothetical protein
MQSKSKLNICVPLSQYLSELSELPEDSIILSFVLTSPHLLIELLLAHNKSILSLAPLKKHGESLTVISANESLLSLINLSHSRLCKFSHVTDASFNEDKMQIFSDSEK